jgi:hypothetical protein
MATTASGVTIPGSSPTTTAATPLQDHFNNLGKSLNGRIIVPVANVAGRASLITALAAEGYTPSTSRPVYVERADAEDGAQIEYTTNGTDWWTLYAGSSAWTSIALDSGLATAATYPDPAWRLERGGTQVRLLGTRITYSPTVNVTAGGANNVAVTAPLAAVARPASGSRFKMCLASTAGALQPAELFMTTAGQLQWRSPIAITAVVSVEWEDMVWQK